MNSRVYTYEEPCLICKGTMQIPGSRNWVSTAWTVATCWHCKDGRVKVSLCYLPGHDFEANDGEA